MIDYGDQLIKENEEKQDEIPFTYTRMEGLIEKRKAKQTRR